MLRTLGLVISIALADSLNPSTIGPSLYLASGTSPRRSVLHFMFGVFAVFLIGGLILTLGPGEAILALVPRPDHTARYVGETVIGSLMLLASAFLWRRHDRLGHREHVDKPPTRRHSPLVLGATIDIVELPTAFPYFGAIVAIVGSGLGVVHQIVLVVIYNVCFVLPLLGIVATLIVAGDEAERTLVALRDYFRAHWPVLLSVFALLAGIFVTVLGVTGLLSGGHGTVGRVSRRVRRVISR